jgi:predicted Zn-dependent protease
MDLEDRKNLISTSFNVNNEESGVHEIVFRWAKRQIELGQYNEALQIMDLALQQNIYGEVPGFSPVFVDSLMWPEDTLTPEAFSDFEIAHHPDSRAHQIYAAAHAAKDDLTLAIQYLEAIEPNRPSLPARTLMARALRQEDDDLGAIEALRPAIALLSATDQEDLAVEAAVLYAELQCEVTSCENARRTLEGAREFFPDNVLIQKTLKELR